MTVRKKKDERNGKIRVHKDKEDKTTRANINV
jgi:hypothetical protein